MELSLRHWPIFATGLLLGAAGAMALGLHRPTHEELASALVAAPVVAQVAAPSTAATLPPTLIEQPEQRAEREAQQMRIAAESFRAQEVLAAAADPSALVVVAQAPRPRVRRAQPAEPAEPVNDVVAAAPPVAAATGGAFEPSEAPAALRPATSVMGASPAMGQARAVTD